MIQIYQQLVGSTQYKYAINKYSNLSPSSSVFMRPTQHTASFQQLMPVSNLEKQLKSNSWNARKQTYDQILYLLLENDPTQQTSRKLLQIGGKQYTVKQLIPFFEDIVDEEHPGVLLTALQCVETMIQMGMCSGREFVKLTDQGFDKFPLKISKGKQIMQKFADIIEKIELDPHFLTKKLNNSAHQKCMIFTLEVVSMLGMTQLYSKVREISHKHPKSAVREVASQICTELEQIANSETQQSQQSQKIESSRENQSQNIKVQSVNKATKVKSIKKLNPQINAPQTNTWNRSELEILEKIPQFQQLKNSKDQQNHTQGLLQLFKKYFQLQKQKKTAPQLPMNQLTNLSHLLRIMVDSNNAIISTNGLKIIKILIQNNSPLIPRSFPLLFIFEKFRLHATHQINHLLYQICDSFLLCNALTNSRSADLIQAVSQGAYNKKANIIYGSFMVFLRTVAILYRNQQLFINSFPVEETGESVLEPILKKINESDVEKIKTKVYRLLTKCYENFNIKIGEDKKYLQKIQDIKIAMSLGYGSGGSATQSAVSSVENLKNKTLKKNHSHVSPQPVSINETKTKSQSSKNPFSEADNQKKSLLSRPIRTQNKQFKIINPEQKMMKIISMCNNPTSNKTAALKKLATQSILQFEQCIQEQRFQLFYYSEVIDNFMNSYSPSDETSQIISEYLLQFLLKVSKVKLNTSTKLLREGLRNLLKLCFCSLVLGSAHLQQILTNFAEYLGLDHVISALLMLDQSKTSLRIKKKNRKTILDWLDANVPAELLTDHLFGVMDKIEKGEMLGNPPKQDIKAIDQEKPEPEVKLQKKITFNHNLHDSEQKIPIQAQRVKSAFSALKNNKTLTYQDEREPHEGKKQVFEEKTKFMKKEPFNADWKLEQDTKKVEIQAVGYLNFSSMPPFESSHISQISQRSDQSGFGLGPSVDNQLEDPRLNQHQEVNESEIYLRPNEDDTSSRKYMQYYAEYKKQMNKQDSQDQKQPHFGVMQHSNNSAEIENRLVDQEQQEQDQYTKIENYRQYISKIRQNYLPADYLNQDNNKQKPKEPSSPKEEIFKPKTNYLQQKQIDKNQKKSESDVQVEQKQEKEQSGFQYKLINQNKVRYLLQNAANPYSHLRNQIILPFKKSDQQEYFLKEINLFITSLQTINHPQPYNSLLLLVILLFSEIHTNRSLITPLQELYEHLASLVSTNQFLKIIISLFHAVIEQTPAHLRTFLITILTKSVGRLMPFCEDSVELLRDLSQFYNVGENVYFEMYETEYAQICKVVEGEALYEVVERALQQEKQNLAVIVQSWFETQLKAKIKQYISRIEEGSEEQIQGQN